MSFVWGSTNCWFHVHILIIVKIVPDVMVDSNMCSKADVWWVKLCFVLVTNYAETVQVIFSNCLFSSDEGKCVNNDRQNQSKEDLIYQNDINILENLEKVNICNLIPLLLEQIAHKATNRFISSDKNKTKAWA